MDAGGGTIDISSYCRLGGNREGFEEIAAPQCKLLFKSASLDLPFLAGHFHGSVFVTLHAKTFLNSKFQMIPSDNQPLHLL